MDTGLAVVRRRKAVQVAAAELTCERDGVATQLTCVGCDAPICPKCLVRTPVGMKCRSCIAGGGPGRRGTGRSRAPLLAGAVAVVLLPAVVWLAFGRSGPASQDGAAKANLDVVNTASESRVGQEVRSGPFSFTVTRVECVGQEVGTPPSTRTAQGRFCLLHLSLRNVGDQPATYSGSAQLLSDTSAKRYNPGSMDPVPPATPLVTGAGDKEITDVRLNPGSEADGVLIFDMPVAAKPAEFEFHSGPRTIGVKVRLDALAS
jgi:hypothetical protein